MQELTPSRRMPSGVAPLAAKQRLVVTRGQLAELGIGHEGVGSRTAQGLWHALGPRVVALHSGTLTTEQRRWAGYLHAGPGAVLALSAAAEAGGLGGFTEREVHVAIEHGREVDDLEHPLVTVRVHQTRHITEDVVPLREPARQSVARAVMEMAAAATSDNRSRALIAAAVQQGLTRPSDLQDFIARRRTLPKRRLLRETVEDVSGGAHSLPELDYARALRRVGLPEPTRQSKVQHPNGVWFLDNDFDEWGVTVEINGAQHHALLARESDDHRRFVHQVRGRTVVDVSSYIVRHRVAVAVLRTAEALTSRGYRPEPAVAAALEALAQDEGWTWLSTPPVRHPA